MQLVNETGAPALLQQADFGSAEHYVVVIVKATYERLEDGRLVPAEDPMPITGDPVETPFGIFHGDIFLRKLGADLAVLGSVWRARAATEVLVRVRCGAFRHTLRVVGDRVWRRSPGGGDTLDASAPAPFREMKLSYARAYGGIARADGLEAPFPDNPIGRGYYLSAQDAVNKPLPNIEEAHLPAPRSWQDPARPAGWGPYPNGSASPRSRPPL
jgi:hypothetical protein